MTLTTRRAALRAVVPGLLAATLTGGALGAAPAQAAFDPSPYCQTAKPSAEQVHETLESIRVATADAVQGAGGLSIDGEAADGSTITYRFDVNDEHARYDGRDGKTREHVVKDGVTDLIYTGHYAADSANAAAALKILGQKRAWTIAHAEGTVDNGTLIDDGVVGVSNFGIFYDWSAEPNGDVFTCKVSGEKLQITDTYLVGKAKQKLRTTYTFSDEGALATVDTDFPGDGPLTAENYGYGPNAIAIPTLVVLKSEWKAALVQGSADNLRKATTKAAKTAIATKKTNADRVKALRAAAVKKAKAYKTAKVKTTNVTNGIKVQVTRPDKAGTYWTFTLKVSGKKVVSTDNIP